MPRVSATTLLFLLLGFFSGLVFCRFREISDPTGCLRAPGSNRANRGIGGYISANFSQFPSIIKSFEDGEKLAAKFVADLNKIEAKGGEYHSAFHTSSLYHTVSKTSFTDLTLNVMPICSTTEKRFPGEISIVFDLNNVTISGTYSIHGKVLGKHLFHGNGTFTMDLRLDCTYHLRVLEENDNLKRNKGSTVSCFDFGVGSRTKFSGKLATETKAGKTLDLAWLQKDVADIFGDRFSYHAAQEYSEVIGPALFKYIDKAFESEDLMNILNYGFNKL